MHLPLISKDQHIDRVIHHELGHWLMARKLGFEVGHIQVDGFGHDAHGLARVYPEPHSQLLNVHMIDDHISKRMMVLCAGVIAEIHWYETKANGENNDIDAESVYANGVIDGSGLNDKAKIDELLLILNAIRQQPSVDLGDQLHDVFSGIYQKASELFEIMGPTFAILGDLLIKEYWASAIRNGGEISKSRIVELERLAQFEIAAAATE